MEMTQSVQHDLSRMDDLSIDSIQKCLKERYERDLIYTNISDILIAINPRKPLSIYDEQTHDKYNVDKIGTELEPHIFQVAATAYRRMLENDANQVIIVSGESGAGKTESTKHMVKHMVHMCQKGDMDLHDKIVKINPLLEAFGNAKTIMNDNSSRYAKYLELGFKDGGELAGAVVRDYMLEKSRVIRQNDGEGIFHIFYALFTGCKQEILDDLFLSEPPDHYRIMQSDQYSLGETEKYRSMYFESMDILGKLNVNTEILRAMLASVILIAEIDFEEDDRGAAQIADVAPFAHAAILLDLDEITFGEALITSKRKVRDDYIATHKTVKQANDARDALAKMLYERLFGWLVRTINQELHPNRLGSNIASNIGILDIAGFEKLQNNSFEQLCINLVNEKLQSFMNRKIFTMEIEIYKEEGVHLDGIDFKNNDDLLEMFEAPKTGVLAILDENSNVQHSSDEGFVDQLKKKFGEHDLFTQPLGDRPIFCIQHFAALVPYNAEGFVEKNRDRLNDELMQVMKESNDDLVSDLFTVKRGPTGTISMEQNARFRASRRGVPVMVSGQPKHLKPTPQGAALAAELGKSLRKKFGTVQRPNEMTQITPGKQHVTLVSFFKNSLMQLLEKLGDGDPFFVRCIKANSNLRPNDFDDAVVTDQLRYNGLAEIAKIRKMGFAVRKLYSEFLGRYRGLFISLPLQRQSDVNQSLLLLVPTAYHRDFRCGTTRIFMTSELNDWFERILRCRQRSAAETVTRCMRKVVEIKKEERRREEERKRLEELEKIKNEKKEAERRKIEDAKLTMLGSSLGRTGPSQWLGATLTGRDPPMPGTSGTSSSSSSENDYNVPPEGHNDLGNTVKPDGRFDYRPPSPVVHLDPEQSHGDEEKTDTETERERKKNETAFWDVCQIIARERKIRDVDEDRGLQVIKVVTYILLFCILLWCAVSQKISLMVLASLPYDRTDNRTVSDVEDDAKLAAARHILLTIAIMIPYCLIFLSSIFKWMFGNLTAPGFSTFFLCLIVEIMHSVGLCILTFIVLPELDMVRGIFLLNGVAILPAVLFPVCASDVKNKESAKISGSRKLLTFVLNIVTVLIQFGYIVVVLLLDHFTADSEMDNKIYNVVLFVVAMIFISFAWWENFVDDRFCGRTSHRGCWRNFILKAKFDLQESRPIISTCTSFVKIGLTLLFSWIIKSFHPENQSEGNAKHISDVTLSEAFDKLDELPIEQKSAIITLTLAAFVGHYVGYTACKLKLQKFSFNIPLVLSTPLAVIIAILDCSGLSLLAPFTMEKFKCREKEEFETWYHYLCGIAVLISLYWLCRHIFYPNIERLAKTERLFMNPFYCGILFEQTMILNRRRHTRKVHTEIKSDKVYYRLSEYNSKVTIEGEEEDDVSSQDSMQDEDIYESKYKNPKFRDSPMIYACATMWHETKYEMLQLMKSLFRMDRDQCIRRHAEEVFQKRDEDFYDFEAHILFDDAMTLNDDDEMVPNDFVKLLMTIMDEAASCVYEKATEMKAPYKVPTPYGGQLIFTLPGDNFLFVHLKDKSKIRHRKRWSQVMYMYYLLGFRIVRMCQETVSAALNEGKINELIQWEQGGNQTGGKIGRSHIFQAFDDQVLKKASNTFLLALDGDVDFSPGAVRLLLDRMRKSEKVGAACGRIHPIGTGPVVWFQKFEYAIAHWLQKATEHVLGCVLCSPGCFSMFRGSALMDDNVMKKYTILPTEAAHHLMYDQGEDRWLCTLLLQQGYRVDYAAGSDAFTYAPEGFAEFFNQRRRWMPSTVFNIIDLLADYKNTVYVNSNISMLYILYQGALLMSTIVGPATVLMMIAGANMVVFKVTVIWGFVISLAPAVFYFLICFYVKPKIQIQIAEIFTALYAFVMMIVLVGTVVTAAQESPLHPSVIFLAFLVVAFTFSAFLHPKEWSCIIFGALYFILIPTGFLLLNIYSLCNLNNVSWGTREVPKKKTKEEADEEKRQAEEKKKKKKERGFFGRFFPTFPTKDVKDLISKITESQNTKKEDLSSAETHNLLKEMNEHLKELVERKNKPAAEQTSSQEVRVEQTVPKQVGIIAEKEPVQVKLKGILKHTHKDHPSSRHASISDNIKNIDDDTDETIYDMVKKKRQELINPAWAECKELGNGKIIPLATEELKFWENFVQKYLEPLQLDDDQKKNIAKGLIELRNNISLGMAMINLLWIAINFMFQFQSPTAISLKVSGGSSDPDSPAGLEENQVEEEDSADNIVKVDVLGLLFIFFYLSILLLQFVGMMIHRWGTFQHLVSVTKLKNPFPGIDRKAKRHSHAADGSREIDAKEARDIIETILKEPLPDYSDDSGAEEEFEKEVREELEVLQKTGSRYRPTVTVNGISATSRRLGETFSDLGRSRGLLSKSSRMIQDGIHASRKRHITAPDGERLRRGMQHEFYKSRDKYVDRPLPPVKHKRLNLGPGRSELAALLQERDTRAVQYFRDSDGPLIPEADPDDDIYDRIGSKGTVSRQIGKRIKLYAKSMKTMETMEPQLSNGLQRHNVVSFQNSGRPTSTLY